MAKKIKTKLDETALRLLKDFGKAAEMSVANREALLSYGKDKAPEHVFRAYEASKEAWLNLATMFASYMYETVEEVTHA